MSKGKSKRPAPPPPKNNLLPAVLSIGVIVLILGVVFAVLFNRGEPSPLETAGNAALESASPAANEALPESTASTDQAIAVFDGPPPLTIDPEANYTATIETPRGPIVIRLRPDIAPMTVNNFIFLANQGFYDGLTWHRVIPGFMAQGGDPDGTGAGGPGYTVPEEFTSEILFDREGIVATARRSDTTNSSGSQFFITLGPAPHLDEQYTIFGEVIENQAIVRGIPTRDPATASEVGETILSITISEE